MEGVFGERDEAARRGMVEAVPCLPGLERAMSGVTYFGVRHLSPASAYHLRRALDAARPRLILVEGPSDLNGQMQWLCHRGTRLPAAILAFTKTTPVGTILYPFADYSPEYQAILWAHENGVECRFMDLPSGTFLALGRVRLEKDMESAEAEAAEEEGATTERVYRRLELLTGEEHDTFWERQFEQIEDTEEYRMACNAFGTLLRENTRDGAAHDAQTAVREAYMKRVICRAIDAGVAAGDIFCVCGAYHVRGLLENPPMSDEEAAALPCLDSSATLMPYSYYRLSSRSGYGAGNKAPAYFELLWDAMNTDGLEGAAYDYMTRLSAAHRKAGNLTSSAEVIEALRLARVLAQLRGSRYPCLQDLRDASVATMGHGNFSELAVAAADTEIGIRVGALPEGAARTSVQEDFYRELKALRLEKFLTPQVGRLNLDLREKLTVQSKDAARIDLRRSFFLHRLRVLGIHFAALLPSQQERANWGEYWDVRWTPEIEIEVVESALLGDTIEGAASYALRERAGKSTAIAEAAEIFRDAFLCGMPKDAAHALSVLQDLAVDAAALREIASTVRELSFIIRYGDLRRFDTTPVIPLLCRLFLRACLILPDACLCDMKESGSVTAAMDVLNTVQLNHEFLDAERWVSLLSDIAERDDLNTRTGGFAMAVLLERGAASEEALGRELSRRLSPGTPADLGAGWFEGLTGKNHHALIARLSLWQQLNRYLDGLDDTEFRRALVFLRRAFAEFSPAEKNDIAENLGEIWGVNTVQAAEVLMGDMTQEERRTLEELDSFDFDDL